MGNAWKIYNCPSRDDSIGHKRLLILKLMLGDTVLRLCQHEELRVEWFILLDHLGVKQVFAGTEEIFWNGETSTGC
jgi:hypothetical protein